MTTSPAINIIVVDDNREAADLTAMLLSMHGFLAVATYGGAECLDLASKTIPDLVLVDLGMPGIDGFAVADRIRNLPHLQNTVLIAYTARSDEATRARTAAAGFKLHLVKPLAVEGILEALARVNG